MQKQCQNNADVTPDILLQPLSISHIQSTYIATNAISNTLTITFNVTNNRPPANVPEIDLSSGPTSSLTIDTNINFENDPHTIKNVLLTDELLSPQATFIGATPTPNIQNSTFAWNLGDIPPLGTVTVTLKVTIPANVADFTPLDTGATTWGTLQNTIVSANSAPITLAPDGLGDWLTCTIDANCHDEYIIKKAAELSNDPVAIFEYVRFIGL